MTLCSHVDTQLTLWLLRICTISAIVWSVSTCELYVFDSLHDSMLTCGHPVNSVAAVGLHECVQLYQNSVKTHFT